MVIRFGLRRVVRPGEAAAGYSSNATVAVGTGGYFSMQGAATRSHGREVEMEPVTVIATAIALGASDGARETTKKAIGDAYAAVKGWITSRYGSVSGEIVGLEQEPEEGLRRALLAKKLDQAGAGNDVELLDLARTLIAVVEDEAPELPAAVGVSIRRVSVGGDIEVANVSVNGGSGVIAEDVTADGSVRIGGVSARSTQEPPHPPQAREQ
ncbi:hypothetical protein GOPIP_039_01390 [Gordonia polyisoprenivorans NBRC 16320 = JCM 10675]|nr:hypothetical protein GOPIP_039_01390 [Gordonia polyisoprenivorans NBRC 16320 = JCM 10675]